MKKVLIITAMLLIALGMNAQSNSSRTRPAGSSEERKAQPAATERSQSNATRTTESRKADAQPAEKPAQTRTQSSQPRTVNTGTSSGNGRSSSYQHSGSGNTRQVNTEVKRETDVNRSTSGTTRTTTTSRTTEVERKPETRSTGSGNSYNSGGTRRTATTTQGNTNRKPGQEYSGRVSGTEYDPKTGQVYVEQRKVYSNSGYHREVRHVPQTNYVYRPVEYRRVHHPYRTPPRVEIIWDYNMYNHYRYLYPEYNMWYYSYGHRIHTVSTYDAGAYIGELVRVYGMVDEVYYARSTDEYYLYFGGPYPYNDFTVIIKGNDARRMSYRPVRYFTGRHIAVTGLISLWDGKPEMIVKRGSQVDLY